MNRLQLTLTILVVGCAMLGCGGGDGPPSPDPQAPEANEQANESFNMEFFAPTEVVGDHSVSLVPGQLNVLSGSSRAELSAVVGKYGYTVKHKNGDWATITLPFDAGLEQAATQLEKEYAIISAGPVHQIHTTFSRFDFPALKQSSYTPLDPMFADQFVSFFFGGSPPTAGYSTFFGQGQPMKVMGFNGAWDVTDPLNDYNQVADEQVIIAIIDAGSWDYSTLDRPGLDELILDDPKSGFMAADGTFTGGLAAAVWELNDDGDPATRNIPYRDTGDIMLGILAATHNTELPTPNFDYQTRGFDFGGDGNITEDDIWNDGIAGINPNATYILIKTGELDVDTWTFSDNHIAESVNHAVAEGANVILLGMFGLGPVGANVSAALQNARDNDVLVFAPAGDVVASFNGSPTPPFFDETPVDISVTSVTPASDPNCTSVTGTGFNRVGALPDVNVDGDDVPNVGRGWTPRITGPEPFDAPFLDVTSYFNTGADIAAVGFGIGFSYHPFFFTGDPAEIIMGESYSFTIARFTSDSVAAYVAGAASMVYQTLSFVNGTPPTDDEVLAELFNTVLYSPMTGVNNPLLPGPDDGGLLNAGEAITSAINGGSLNTILPALAFSQVVLSHPLGAVTRGEDVQATPTIANGTAPFVLEIDWGDGGGPQVVDPWVNGEVVELTGGYGTLGLKGINLSVSDDDGRTAIVSFEIHVINPLGGGVSITDVNGAAVVPTSMNAAENYRWHANLTNVYTGDIGGGTPNTTTLNWYFTNAPADPMADPLPAADSNDTSPVFAFPSPGDFTVTLIVEEDFRPRSVFTLNASVS